MSPIPTFSKLGPDPSFGDIATKVNTIVSELTNLMLNLDSLNVTHLTAETIDTGTLDANLVTIRSDLSGGGFVQIDGNGLVINNGTENTFQTDLQGNVTARSMHIIESLNGGASINIDDTGMVVNDGSQNTFTVDINGHVTMTGATIASGSGYPRIEMNSTSDLFGAYTSASNYIQIRANDAGLPQLYFENGSNTVRQALVGDLFTLGVFGRLSLASSDSMEITTTGSSSDLILSPGSDIFLSPVNGLVRLLSFSNVFSASDTINLQQALDAKATLGAPTSTAGAISLNGGIPIGASVALSSDGTTITGTASWAGINHSGHTHIQN